MMLPNEIIVDSFAGGGGASQGIEEALGRPVDYALNHDAEAIALHAENHPETVHLVEDLWGVHPLEVTGGRPVALGWFSPDCKHFSKAKGGKPVEKKIRALAWLVLRWAALARPRVIMLENVEEFADWGPLTRGGRPCRKRRGWTFQQWVGQLRDLGYVVDWRELRACDYGAPTIRKRLFLIARRDGLPIVWPLPSHGPGLEGLAPYRSAADCIDWSLPCPSIFERKRPLAEATMKRIAAGLRRYVLDSADPFIVPLTHGGGENRAYDIHDPLRTITTAQRGEFAYVTPYLAGVGGRAGQSRPRGIGEPIATMTAKADAALVTPFLARQFGNSVGQDGREPLGTVMPGGGGKTALVTPCIISVAHGYSGGRREYPMTDPLGTLTQYTQHALMAPTLIQTGYGEREGQAPRVPGLEKPLGTVVAGGSKHAVVAAWMAQMNTGMTGHPMTAPVSTIVQKGCTQALVSAFLTNFRGSNTGGGQGDPRVPFRALTAGGQHVAEVRAFLMKYYGSGGQWQDPRAPLHTLTAKARLGLVTVAGTQYQIVDIGLRMLTPRELYRAQGFPGDYKIEFEFNGKPLTKAAQIRMCGNSVCPPLARALVEANLGASASAGREGRAA